MKFNLNKRKNSLFLYFFISFSILFSIVHVLSRIHIPIRCIAAIYRNDEPPRAQFLVLREYAVTLEVEDRRERELI